MVDKDNLAASFGIIIAYLLPGLSGLYALSLFSDRLRVIFQTFLTAASNVGLFLLVVAAALVLGLLVNVLRYWFFECCIFKSLRIGRRDILRICNNELNLTAYSQTLSENFRYHQFYGATFLLLPFLYVGWARNFAQSKLSLTFILVSIGFLLVSVGTLKAANEAFRRYVERTRRISRLRT
jgi:hypothetical protein